MIKAMMKVSNSEALEIHQHIRTISANVHTSPDGSTVVVEDAVIAQQPGAEYMIFISTNPATRKTVVDLVPERMRHRLWDMSHA